MGFFANRTVAQHTRKAMENRNSNVVRVATVWVSLRFDNNETVTQLSQALLMNSLLVSGFENALG